MARAWSSRSRSHGTPLLTVGRGAWLPPPKQRSKRRAWAVYPCGQRCVDERTARREVGTRGTPEATQTATPAGNEAGSGAQAHGRATPPLGATMAIVLDVFGRQLCSDPREPRETHRCRAGLGFAAREDVPARLSMPRGRDEGRACSITTTRRAAMVLRLRARLDSAVDTRGDLGRLRRCLQRADEEAEGGGYRALPCRPRSPRQPRQAWRMGRPIRRMRARCHARWE